MTQLVTEFAANDFVPGVAVKTEVGVRSQPAENTPIRLLIAGFKTSDGSISDGQIVGPILSEEQAAEVGGAKSRLARCFRAGFKRSQDVEVWFGGVAENSAGTAAKAKATIGGTWTTAGEVVFLVDGDEIRVTVGADDSTSDVAAATSDKADTLPNLRVVVTDSGAEVLFTQANKGTHGNVSQLYVDLRSAPAGLTVSLEPPEAELVALVNELRTDMLAHFALTSGGVHGGADSTSGTGIGSASTNVATALTLVNQLRTAYELHRALTSGSVHGAADSTNTIALTAATTGQEAVALANQIKTKYNAHRILTSGSVHGAADSTNATTADNAVTGLVTGDEVTGDGVYFSGGAGTEDASALITAIQAHPKQFKRVLVSSLDTTNLGLWEDFADEQVAPLVKKPSILIVGHPGTQAAATSIARTTLNHESFSLLWARDSQTPSDELATVHAFDRVLTERNGPGGWNSSHSGKVLPGVKLARDRSKLALDHATQKAALQNGIMPVTLNANDEAMIVKAITTRCQAADGSDDYSALDVAETVVTYEMQERKARIWEDYRSRNKHVRDDFGANEKVIPLVATPSGFSRFLVQQTAALVDERVFESTPVARSTYNRTTKRIQTEFEFYRMPLHEQGESIVRGLV